MSNSLCIVTHDLHPYGAQRVALSLAREWTLSHQRHVEVITCGGGALSAAARRLAPVTALGEHWRHQRRSLSNIVPLLRRAGVRAAITNTVITGNYCRDLDAAGIPTVSLIHEMPSLITKEGVAPQLLLAHQHAKHVVYPHAAVFNGISNSFPDLPNWDRVKIIPQGLETVNPYRANKSGARDRVRSMLRIAPDSRLALAVATGDRRKGIDLFLDAALVASQREDIDPVQFLWIGPLNDADIAEWSQRNDARVISSIPNLHWLDFQTDTAVFYAAADVFVLTSREDPFPFVVLESLDAGVPVAAFTGSGGGAELASRGCGINVSEMSGAAMARALNDYLANDVLRYRDGHRGTEIIDTEYRVGRYAQQLLDLVDSLRTDSAALSMRTGQ